MDFTNDGINCMKCQYRHPDNGNCTAVGGFCTAVPAAYCPLIPELLSSAEAAEARCATLEKMVKEYQEELIPGYRDRAEKSERDRDAAASDIETVMAYGGGTCQFCKNAKCYARGGTKPCLPKWRGRKEE